MVFSFCVFAGFVDFEVQSAFHLNLDGEAAGEAGASSADISTVAPVSARAPCGNLASKVSMAKGWSVMA
jgi:hypothetical protein